MSMKKTAEQVLGTYFQEKIIVKKTRKADNNFFFAQISKEGSDPFWTCLAKEAHDDFQNFHVSDDWIADHTMAEILAIIKKTNKYVKELEKCV